MGHEQQGENAQSAGRVHSGAEETDNPLPKWWLGALWGLVLLGAGFWMDEAAARLRADARTTDARDAAAQDTDAPGRPALTDEVLLALSRDAAAVERGEALFTQHCAACHGEKAQGAIAPDLTDASWLHGGKPLDIQRTVAQGVVAKGMPAWERALGPRRVQQLVAYLLTVRSTQARSEKP